MKSNELRARFLDYFKGLDHQVVASSSLIPADDPTLLFANAGMNQFKNLFLGQERRGYNRACTSQKCVRAGGKHNDLENVGYTARHHTFFEMLGNFSFGNYFKREAIRYAWDFLTRELGVDATRLYITVFREDDEAERLWMEEAGIGRERIFRFDEKDNFWAMGDTGPCGPCSEIYYDFGALVEGPDDPQEGIACGSDRFMEIWNLVFMQFDRQGDGTLLPLPNPSIDTGMGLERICAVVQGVVANYETDLFTDLLRPIAGAMKVDMLDPAHRAPLRVIADHLRALSFLIADGVVPSNEGRGYVLRRIMRRAMRFGKQLGMQQPFLAELTRHVVEKMGSAYPELLAEAEQIRTLVRLEEQQFDLTLSRGLPILQKYLEDLARQQARKVPGQLVFFMYGTHGFPLDLMADVARDWGMTLDMEGYEQARALEAQASSAEGAFQARVEDPALVELAARAESVSTCHLGLQGKGKVLLVLPAEEDAVQVVLDSTPFYGESGGQIGDRGVLATATGRMQVERTAKVHERLIVHHGRLLEGSLVQGQEAFCQVEPALRAAIMKNHSATHLLHQALKDVLGRHVRQAGSLVEAERLRFDFSHFLPLDVQQVAEVEAIVNGKIQENHSCATRIMALEAARQDGACALFGEKYGAEVRVVAFGDYSKELCGGTHVAATGEIGVFKILSERALASGIRRIVAVTGPAALARFQESEALLRELQERFHLRRESLLEQLQKAGEERRQLEQRLEELKLAAARGSSGNVAEERMMVAGIQVLRRKVDGLEGGALRQLADELLGRVPGGVVLLGSSAGGKAYLVVKSQARGVHAGELVRAMAELVGGSGGGKAEMAMAGGKDPQHLERALDKGLDLIKALHG